MTVVQRCITLVNMRKQTHIGLRVGDALLEKIDGFKERDRRDSRASTVRVILERFFEEHPEIVVDESAKT